MNSLKDLGNIMGFMMEQYEELGAAAFYSNRRMILNLHRAKLIDDGEAARLLAFNIKESENESSGLIAR